MQMEPQKHSETEILKLGKLLVEELNSENRINTLSRWMSHYLAEKITMYESLETGEEKETLGKEIFNMVIQLWDRNKVFQEETNPLHNLQNAIRNLNALQNPEKRNSLFKHPLFESKKNNKRTDEFIKDLKETYLGVANALIIASLLPDHLKKSTKWKEDFGGLLSEDEKKVIDTLNYHLDEYRSSQIVFLEDEKQIPKEEDTLFLNHIITTIEKRLEQMVTKFQSVKDTFESK